MNRVRRLDIAIVAIATPLWLLCVFLHGRLVWTGGLSWVPVYVSTESGLPEVTGLWVERTPEEVGVQAGDRLLSLAGESLAEVDRVQFLRRVYDHSAAEQPIPLRIERDGAEQDAALILEPIPYPWRTVPMVLSAGLMAFLLYLRGRGAQAGRAWALAGIAWSFHWSLIFAYPGWQAVFGLPFFLIGAAFYHPLLVRACLLTPETSRPPRWLLLLPWVFLINGVGTASWIFGVPFDGVTGTRIVFGVNLLSPACAVAAIVHNYLRADAIGRRQLKWVVFGLVAGALPVIVASGIAGIYPELWWLYDISLIFTVLAPLGVFVAFVRFNFLDIDRLMSATTGYLVLSIVALGFILSVTPVVARIVSEVAQIGTAAVQTLLSWVAAVVIIPSERALRPHIERLLYRERKSLEQGLAAMRIEIGKAPTASAVLSTVGNRLTELLRLDSCVIYSRSDDFFAPAFAHGSGVPPGFSARGALAELLRDRPTPVSIAEWRRWARRGRIDEVTAAALETLGATVILPIHQEDSLEAFVCLGEKQSGDIFTQSDLALLEGIADRASFALLHFDQRELARAGEELREAMQSYVPGAVADEIASGRALESGSREVTVLFVDIRGYTGFSESRSPEEIFEAINTYTTRVSEIVRDHGGTVVDFQGDGLFSVFGAPRELPEKETAALEAGLAIADAVRRLELGSSTDPLEAGVGIATGDAYVGNIRAVDRRIWGVIGNTTNLAARLQGLTRDLDADVVVDALTRTRVPQAVHALQPVGGVRVKGRSDAIDVYIQPRVRPIQLSAA